MGRALVIGGSLGGLFAGLLLRQSGWDVAVFERSSGDLASRGVGIGTHVEQFEIMRRLGITVDERIGIAVTSRICLDRDGAVIARLPFEKTLTSWALFYRALRRRLPDACYRPGMTTRHWSSSQDAASPVMSRSGTPLSPSPSISLTHSASRKRRYSLWRAPAPRSCSRKRASAPH
jgi:2-polyprenyl-6-methoxyphenol hydroxylase-like FAD-dependent oxidoreductase